MPPAHNHQLNHINTPTKIKLTPIKHFSRGFLSNLENLSFLDTEKIYFSTPLTHTHTLKESSKLARTLSQNQQRLFTSKGCAPILTQRRGNATHRYSFPVVQPSPPIRFLGEERIHHHQRSTRLAITVSQQPSQPNTQQDRPLASSTSSFKHHRNESKYNRFFNPKYHK